MTTPIAGANHGQRTYALDEGFFKRPLKWTFVEVADVDVDADDNVYVFNRGVRPVMIFDKNGAFLDSWGSIGPNGFITPHGLTVGPEGSVYTADTGDHTVRRWTNDGRLLLTLGMGRELLPPDILTAQGKIAHAPADTGIPFNRPTHFTVAGNGDYYASDGYGNSHVHCFSPDGKLKFSWGGRGKDPGHFDTIHSVWVDRADGDKIYCADRWNNRVQFFTATGDFLGQWDDLAMPNSVRKGPDGAFYIAELGHRVTVRDADGTLLARWGDDATAEDMPTGKGLPTSPARNPMQRGKVLHEPGPGQFSAPHGIAVDSRGNIYVADVAESWAGLDRGDRSIQRFVRT